MNAPTMSPTITGGTRAPTTSAPTAPTTTAAPSTFGTSRSQYIYQKLATYNTAWPEYLQQQRFSGETSDAFTFFKANPFLFHLDYDLDPRLALFGTNFTRIWISGDQHLDNFGTVCVYLDRLLHIIKILTIVFSLLCSSTITLEILFMITTILMKVRLRIINWMFGAAQSRYC